MFIAMMQSMDFYLGQLVDSPEPEIREQLKNTIFIFLGDNGTPNQVIQAPFSNGHSKDSLYEGGIHVPLIISGPDIVSPNRDNSAPTPPPTKYHSTVPAI